MTENPPFDLRILVSRFAEEAADIIARVKAEPGTMPDFIQVGQVGRVSHEGEPEEWKAWLWQKGGVYPPTDTHCEAFTRPSCGDLEVLLNKKLKAEGQWWK